jgi:hypothetical protein
VFSIGIAVAILLTVILFVVAFHPLRGIPATVDAVCWL